MKDMSHYSVCALFSSTLAKLSVADEPPFQSNLFDKPRLDWEHFTFAINNSLPNGKEEPFNSFISHTRNKENGFLDSVGVCGEKLQNWVKWRHLLPVSPWPAW